MTTYAILYQDIQDWSENDDSECADELDTIIGLAEERIFREAPFIPAARGQDTGNCVSSTEEITLGATTRSIRSISVTVSGSEVVLHQRLDSFIRDYNPAGATGVPKYYAQEDDNTIILAPIPNSTYAYTIYASIKPTGLSSGNTTTWLGTNANDLLLFACMVEASAFMKNDVGMARWEGRYQVALASIQGEMMRDIGNESTVGA